MLSLFGKPTRSEKIEYCVSYFSQETDKKVFIYFEKTSFESCKDSVALGRLDFTSTDRQLVFPNITLTKNTKLSDLATIFPKSFAIRYPIGEKDERQMVVPLIFFPCSDDKLLLIFENEQLVAVDYYMPY